MPAVEGRAPRHVAILGLGPSLEAFVDRAKRLGDRRALCDEVWGINATGGVLQTDRIYHMDDVELQQRRAAARPDSNIARMMGWLKDYPGPVYTSRAVPGWPNLVPFPLEEAARRLGSVYFNSTAAYAVAHAIMEEVTTISLWGLDYTYPNAHHAEQGRACVEYWLGIATSLGIEIRVPEQTTLLDACGSGQPYGYDAHNVTVSQGEDGRPVIGFEPKPLPTAEEIEARYDHSRHPNEIIRRATDA